MLFIRRSIQAAYIILPRIFMRRLVADTVNFNVSATTCLIKMHGKILYATRTDLLMMKNICSKHVKDNLIEVN